jgi:leucyl-tRNA synthetase
MHRDLVDRFIRTQALLVAPIAPHYAEHVWSTILKEPRSIQHALFPEPAAKLDEPLLRQLTFVRDTIVKAIRDGEAHQSKKASKAKGGKQTATTAYDAMRPISEKAVRIFVAQRYPVWQERTMSTLRELRAAAEGVEVTNKDIKEAMAKLDGGAFLKAEKRAMPFAALQAVRSIIRD